MYPVSCAQPRGAIKVFQGQGVPTERSALLRDFRPFLSHLRCSAEGGEVCESGQTKGVLLLEILIPGSLYPGAICRCLPGD